MNEKKYQVFISSTYLDLKEERKKILDILLMASCIPAGMESFVATDDEQFEVIKKVIDLCDYYVLLIGQRYGSINEITGISYTEMEYDYAKEKGIPVLVFSLDNSVILDEYKVERTQENKLKLQKFKDKAMKNRLASIWKTQDELVGQLAVAIMKAQTDIPRPGWQRANDFDEVSLRREIAELQNNYNLINDELLKSKEIIKSLKPNIEFENCEFDCSYIVYDMYNKKKNKLKKSLPDLFRVISLEMIDRGASEITIYNAIKKHIYKNLSEFVDNQLINKIINQLRALNFIESFYTKNGFIAWKLTYQGKIVMEKLTLQISP